MRTDIRAQIEAMLDDYQGLTSRLDAVRADFASLTATARSTDGSVTATVGPHGELVALVIDQIAARRLATTSLAARVLEAAGLAVVDVRRQAGEMMAGVMPGRIAGAIKSDGTVDISGLLPAFAADHSSWTGRR